MFPMGPGSVVAELVYRNDARKPLTGGLQSIQSPEGDIRSVLRAGVFMSAASKAVPHSVDEVGGDNRGPPGGKTLTVVEGNRSRLSRELLDLNEVVILQIAP